MARIVGLMGAVLTTAGLAACATGPSGRAAIETPTATCREVTIPIYFEPNEAEVTPEGRGVLAAETRAVRGCRIEGVRVVGLADAVGDPAANLELSKRRAASVAEAIKAAGLPDAEFEMAAAGQADSISSDGQLRPLRRRADVTLRVSPP
ncbi:OmpA family protein [Phenylobacterium sp.]|uniref:OmpA family protein n=1 Tax=Phenylobacterium sp. TaxID=1871053 RepID=UPI00301D5194